jgi:hypothetical protein
MIEMWSDWDALIMRARVNESAGAVESVVRHGVWPAPFFEGITFTLFVALAYMAAIVALLIYRDKSRRQKKVIDMTAARVAWNMAWTVFSAVTWWRLTYTLLDYWYLSSRVGYYDGICLSLDTVMVKHRDTMILLFVAVLARPLKLYEVLFSESHGKTEPNHMLVSHLTSPLLMMYLAARSRDTAVLAAYTALLSYSEMWAHAWFLMREVLRRSEARPTMLLKALISCTQLSYSWGAFLLASVVGDCAGKFTGNMRITYMMVCMLQSALLLRNFNERIFGLSEESAPTPESTPPRRKKKQKKK